MADVYFLIILIIIFIVIIIFFLIVRDILDNNENIAGDYGNETLRSLDFCERDVSDYLKSHLDKTIYKLIDNILIPSGSGTKYSQIDHVVVSNYGIFCIETKSHSGWIIGDINERNWKQSFYDFRRKCKYQYPFYSPLLQNQSHIYSLKKLIGQNLKMPIISILVFPNADKILVRGINNIGNVEKLLEVITRTRISIYNPDEKSRIVNSILNANITDASVIRKHNEGVQQIDLAQNEERLTVEDAGPSRGGTVTYEREPRDNSFFDDNDDDDDDDDDHPYRRKKHSRDYDDDNDDDDRDDD